MYLLKEVEIAEVTLHRPVSDAMSSDFHALFSIFATAAPRDRIPSRGCALIWRPCNELGRYVVGGANLLRALIARSGATRDRILLTEVSSVDWQSLTFMGERHFALRVCGPDSGEVVRRMCGGLEDAEFSIPGQIVADVTVFGKPVREPDGSTSITIEALTIGE